MTYNVNHPLLSDMTVIEWTHGDPVYGCNGADKLDELVHVVGSEPRHKHVVGHVIDVVPHPVVRTEECLHTPQCILDRVRMSEQRRT